MKTAEMSGSVRLTQAPFGSSVTPRMTPSAVVARMPMSMAALKPFTISAAVRKKQKTES